MAVLAVIGGFVVAYTIWMFLKFSNFKSRLMNEFGRQDVPYKVADHVYFRAGDFINSMHANGAQVEEIVVETIRRYPEYFILNAG